MITSGDRPWTSAAYLVDDPEFTGVQHGVESGGTLCGLSPEEIAVVRNPFWGEQPRDCPACADRLRSLAAGAPPVDHRMANPERLLGSLPAGLFFVAARPFTHIRPYLESLLEHLNSSCGLLLRMLPAQPPGRRRCLIAVCIAVPEQSTNLRTTGGA